MTDGLLKLDGPTPAGPRRRRRGRGVFAGAVVVLVLVVLAVAAWLTVRGVQAASALRSVADGVVVIRDAAAAGDLAGLDGLAADTHRDARRAADATGDPVWWLAERLPIVGADAAAVRTAAEAVDTLAGEALVPLVALGSTLDPESLRPVDGRIDVAPLLEARPVVDRAVRATARVRADVDALDPTRLHGPVRGAIEDLRRHTAVVDDALAAASRAAALLPPMLGTEEPRDYLVLFLNSAELRTQGGIIGALAVIRAQDGRLQLTDQASTLDMPFFAEPVLPLTPAELAVASDVVGRRIQNPVILPDTPRAGQLAAEMWRLARGRTVDGVVAVDTVALSYVLGAIGAVQHPDGAVLTADTLLQTLLVTTYAEHPDQAGSDAFFARTAEVVFGAFASGAGDPLELVQALRRSADERRLSVWSAHPEEQERIAGSAVDGALLSGGHDDAVGVFLDNTSGWKTDTFLRSDVTLDSVRCDDGTATLELGLRLTNTMGPDATSLPVYVVGDGSTGVPVGSMRTRVSVYSPVDGAVAQVRRGEQFVGTTGTTMAGRDVRVLTESLAAGESVELSFTVTGPVRGDRLPVWSTPTTTSPGLAHVPLGCADE